MIYSVGIGSSNVEELKELLVLHGFSCIAVCRSGEVDDSVWVECLDRDQVTVLCLIAPGRVERLDCPVNNR